MVAGGGYKVTEINQSQGMLQKWNTLNKTGNSQLSYQLIMLKGA